MPDPTPTVVPEVPITIPGIDPNLQPKPLSPDDDPNLKLQKIVSRRREDKPDKPEDKKPEDKKPEPPVAIDNKKLSGLIGKALGFREEKPEEDKKDDKKSDKKPDEAAPEPEAKKTDEPEKVESKTIVKPKKQEKPSAPAADPVKMAAAAATAAVKAMVTDQRPPPKAETKPEDLLKAGDLHEFEVAGHLARINPKYKDAQRIILEQVKKADTYANNWEAANKGKIFDPDDEDHDEFYESLKKPWSETEFHAAEVDMSTEKAAQKISVESDKRIKELELENARHSLATVVDRTYTVAAGLLAKKVNPEIHDKIVKNTFEKFAEEDPLMAEALANAVGPLQPLIEAAIQLDDPKGRFKLDPNNEIHREWNRLILEKEEQLNGTTDDSGKKFSTRYDYSQMGPSERNRHWYLTTEHLIESLVDDAAESVKTLVEKDKERHKKIALSLGFIPKTETPPKDDKSDTSKNGKPSKLKEEAQDTVKPVSPSVGGGVKVDDKGAGNPASSNKLLETTASILFRR